jgi:hypothetical protein
MELNEKDEWLTDWLYGEGIDAMFKENYDGGGYVILLKEKDWDD